MLRDISVESIDAAIGAGSDARGTVTLVSVGDLGGFVG